MIGVLAAPPSPCCGVCRQHNNNNLYHWGMGLCVLVQVKACLQRFVCV